MDLDGPASYAASYAAGPKKQKQQYLKRGEGVHKRVHAPKQRQLKPYQSVGDDGHAMRDQANEHGVTPGRQHQAHENIAVGGRTYEDELACETELLRLHDHEGAACMQAGKPVSPLASGTQQLSSLHCRYALPASTIS